MSATFDFYTPGRSWLHRIDPRVKLAFVALGLVLLLIWANLPLFVAALLLIHMALWSAGVSRVQIAVVWRALAPFLILIALLYPIFNREGAPVLVELGPLVITGRAVLGGIAAALRIAAVSFVFVLWLSTTDQRQLVRSFVRLGLPFSLGMALTIGLRFIPTFAGVFHTVSEAQQARGLVLTGRGFRRLRAMIPILIAALVTVLRMSEQLGWTLASRAFGAPVRRTTLHDLAMRPLDWIVLLVVILGLGGLLALSWSMGLGRDLLELIG